MTPKDIYKIDNYFIAIGWLLLIAGVLSVTLDPFRWNEVVIKEKTGNNTQYTFDNKNGRTLEQIRQEKGARFEVEAIERGFPLVRTIIIANGLILLIVGYGFRSREKKIIAIWNALEHAGEANVASLTVALGLPREFILKHLKDINAQQQSAYAYESRSDKIINSRLQSEFLVFADCNHCGHKINQKVSLDLSNPPRCQYCGNGVPAEHLNQLRREVLDSLRQTPASSPVAAAGQINMVLLVVLLLLFWPAAIVYVIKKRGSPQPPAPSA